jgi:hypothetical protein
LCELVQSVQHRLAGNADQDAERLVQLQDQENGAGVGMMLPPKVAGAPKPTSLVRISRMFGRTFRRYDARRPSRLRLQSIQVDLTLERRRWRWQISAIDRHSSVGRARCAGGLDLLRVN